MSGYTLAPPACEDLIAIRDYYLDTANPKIARQMLAEFVNAFRSIARTPGIGHGREDLAANRAVLFWPLRDYLIIYRASARPVEIVTILHGNRDVEAILKRQGI